jgi:hypothetical protein
MLTKDDILESLLHECDVVTHLATTIPTGGLAYKQSESQRTNLELLRYLSYCAIAGTRYFVDGDWVGYKEWEELHAGVTIEDFPAAMERQKEALRAAFAPLTDDDLQRETTHPMGHKLTLHRGLLECPLKWMVGYRMQLFCGLKAAGNDEIWTPDCWAGVSMPRQTQPA